MDFRQVLPQEHHNINPTEFKERGFKRLDIGHYKFLVEGSDLYQDERGEAVIYKLKIVEGKDVGLTARVFIRYKHTNEKATEVGISQLKEFYASCGLEQLGDYRLPEGKTTVGYLYYRLNTTNGKQQESFAWMNGANKLVLDGKYKTAPEDMEVVKQNNGQSQQPMQFGNAPAQQQQMQPQNQFSQPPQQQYEQPQQQYQQEPVPFQSYQQQ